APPRPLVWVWPTGPPPPAAQRGHLIPAAGRPRRRKLGGDSRDRAQAGPKRGRPMFIYPYFAGQRHRDLIAAAGASWDTPAVTAEIGPMPGRPRTERGRHGRPALTLAARDADRSVLELAAGSRLPVT